MGVAERIRPTDELLFELFGVVLGPWDGAMCVGHDARGDAGRGTQVKEHQSRGGGC